MSFIDSVKKKLLGDDSPVQMAPKGGRKIGSMGKVYAGGGGGGAIKTDKGVGFDASTYSHSGPAPAGRVGSLNEFNPNRMGKPHKDGFAGVKAAGKEVFDYVAPKAKAAGKWMQERGHELSESPAYERAEHRGKRSEKRERHWSTQGTTFINGTPYEEVKPRKKTSSRLPRGSQPAGYDGNFDMFGVGGFGGGFGGGYESEEYEAPRRKKKSRRRAEYREREESGGFDMNHVPDSLRGMF